MRKSSDSSGMNRNRRSNAGTQVDGNTDPSAALRQQLGTRPERLRSSMKRRENLETHLFMHIEEETRVVLGDFPTASVFLNTDTADIPDEFPVSSAFLEEDIPVVYIPTRRIEQSVTDYDREEFDQIVQYAYADHERGHIEYTPGAYINSKLNQMPSGKRNAVHSIINSLEDGAIEEQLRSKNQTVGLRLSTLHANLAAEKLCESENSGLTRTFATAVIGYILDLGRYDAGFTRILLNESDDRISFVDSDHKRRFREFRPQVENVVSEVLTASTPYDRADRMIEFAEMLVGEASENIEDIATDGQTDQRGMGEQIGGGTDRNQTNDSGSESAESTNHNTSKENIRSRARKVLNDDAVDPGSKEGDSRKNEKNGIGVDNVEGGESSTDNTNASDDGNAGADNSAESDSLSDDIDAGDMNESGANEGSAETAPENDPTDTTEHENGKREEGNDDPSVNADSDRKGEQGSDGAEDVGIDTDHKKGVESGREEDENAPSGTGDDGLETDEGATEGLDGSRREEEKVADRQEKAMEEAIKNHTESMESTPSDSVNDKGGNGITFVPPSDNFNLERWMKARSDSQTLMKQLGKMLGEQQSTEWKRGVPTGQIDDSFIVDLLLGADNCMRQRQQNVHTASEISVIMMIDRSTSMTQDDIACAERAGAGLALAFERQNIDVSVMDMYLNTARVAKPFEFPVSQQRKMLITGECGGKTPLSDTLSVAADRVRWKRGETFVVVITDGRPNSPDAYRNTLNKIGQFAHVVGVEIALGQQRDRPQYGHNYHLGTSVSTTEELVNDIDQMMAKKVF